MSAASPSPVEFSALIRRLRLEQGLSIADFGQRVGLSTSDAERLEAANSEIGLNELFAIGRGLGMDVSAIFRTWETRGSAILTCELDWAPHGSTPP